MNAQRFIAIDAVLSLPTLSALNATKAAVTAAVSQSQTLALAEDGAALRPVNLTVARTTLIVRDFPIDTTTHDAVCALFPATGQPTSATLEVGNNWFVKFATEEACLAAAEHLRALPASASPTGKPISFRIKSENLLSTYARPRV